jgi:hypothetical protein
MVVVPNLLTSALLPAITVEQLAIRAFLPGERLIADLHVRQSCDILVGMLAKELKVCSI